eukprot:contig_17118_g4161
MVLKGSCGGDCQADLVARVTAAGCDQVRLFPTLRMASARCVARRGGGGGASDAAEGGGGMDLSGLPGVESVSPDMVVTISPPAGETARNVPDAEGGAAALQEGAVPWGLDRVNQAALPLDGNAIKTCYPSRGAGVTVYVLDSGIATGHAQFGGRAWGVVAPGTGFPTADDENGHGSHVAGTVAGATTGVAPAATIVGVRCLDEKGAGRLLDVVAAIEYVVAVKAANPGAKVVLNASLGLDLPAARPWSEAANRANNVGVIVVVAAGCLAPRWPPRTLPASPR